ncbi:hypothetical protein BJ742DRAFT_832208 [Cladochytrium replicatum]|nr:hypothetical protein BJ742DRAFT_832208 [Cladochytrium replicatum]
MMAAVVSEPNTHESGETINQHIDVELDAPVTSMSISPWGRDVALAAKMGLWIIDLEKPFERPRIMQHVTKWEVSDVQWNPHKSHGRWIASTSNQSTLIWNVTPSGAVLEGQSPRISHGRSSSVDIDYTPSYTSDRTLQSEIQKKVSGNLSSKNVAFILSQHSRAVSDLNWSPIDPYLLATCSNDTKVLVWDMRTSPVHSVMTFSHWTSGATQVKWNKVNESILASSHDTELRVWDKRKGAKYISITAHTSKIYGIDWSWDDENAIITCSRDKNIKFWDIHQSRTPQGTINTHYPVWRARFTPFGKGVLAMPQSGDNSLFLYSITDFTRPAYTFAGHTDVPREFVWRKQSSNKRNGSEFQLVTWAKDKHLKLWPIDTAISTSIGELDGLNQDSGVNSPETAVTILPQSVSYVSLFSNTESTSQAANSEKELLLTSKIEKPSIIRSTAIAPSLLIGEPRTTVENQKRTDSVATVEPQRDVQQSIISSEIISSVPVQLISTGGRFDDELNAVLQGFPTISVQKTDETCCTFGIQRSISSDDEMQMTPSLSTFNSVAPPFFRLTIRFPEAYPPTSQEKVDTVSAPIFEVHKTGMVSMVARATIAKALNQTAVAFVSHGLPCLEACFRLAVFGEQLLPTNFAIDNSDQLQSSFVTSANSLLSPTSPSLSGLQNSVDVNTNINEKSYGGIEAVNINRFSRSSINATISDKASNNNENVKDPWLKQIQQAVEPLPPDSLFQSSSKKDKSRSDGVPCPRVCGATFSVTGKLIYFMNPLPHPTELKITMITLETRNKVPRLQPRPWLTMPRNLTEYMYYLNHAFRNLGQIIAETAAVRELTPLESPLHFSPQADLNVGEQDFNNLFKSGYSASNPISLRGSRKQSTVEPDNSDELLLVSQSFGTRLSQTDLIVGSNKSDEDVMREWESLVFNNNSDLKGNRLYLPYTKEELNELEMPTGDFFTQIKQVMQPSIVHADSPARHVDKLPNQLNKQKSVFVGSAELPFSPSRQTSFIPIFPDMSLSIQIAGDTSSSTQKIERTFGSSLNAASTSGADTTSHPEKDDPSHGNSGKTLQRLQIPFTTARSLLSASSLGQGNLLAVDSTQHSAHYFADEETGFTDSDDNHVSDSQERTKVQSNEPRMSRHSRSHSASANSIHSFTSTSSHGDVSYEFGQGGMLNLKQRSSLRSLLKGGKETAPETPTAQPGTPLANTNQFNYFQQLLLKVPKLHKMIKPIVHIRNMGNLVNSFELAKSYTLNGLDAAAVCEANCKAAKDSERMDLAKLWSLASLILCKSVPLMKGVTDHYQDKSKQLSVMHPDLHSAHIQTSQNPEKPKRTSKKLMRKEQMRHGMANMQNNMPRTAEQQNVSIYSNTSTPTFRIARDGQIVENDEAISLWHNILSLAGQSPKDGDNNLISRFFASVDWENHPFGRKLAIDYLLGYVSSLRDFQSEALFSCILADSFVHFQRRAECSEAKDVLPRSSQNVTIPNVNAFSGKAQAKSSLPLVRDFAGRTVVSSAHQRKPLAYAEVVTIVGNEVGEQNGFSVGRFIAEDGWTTTSGEISGPSGRSTRQEVGDAILELHDLNFEIPISPTIRFFVNRGRTLTSFRPSHGKSDKMYLTDGEELQQVYKRQRIVYASLLYDMGLTKQRAEMLAELASICKRCKALSSETSGCAKVSRVCDLKQRCSVCRRICKSLSSFCRVCGHGGHIQHLQSWFSDNTMCPTGCGCECSVHSGGYSGDYW